MKRFLIYFINLCILLNYGSVFAQDDSRDHVLNKMSIIRIPELEFRQANLVDVVAFLNQQSVEFDPEPDPSRRTGVQIISLVDRRLAISALITFSALDITLKDALDYSAQIAGCKYYVENNRVILFTQEPNDHSQISSSSSASSVTRSIQADDLFQRVRGSLVIITTPHTTASGFVMQQDQRLYLITNEHVIRGGRPKLSLLNGQNLEWSQLEVADDYDLVRLELEISELPSLIISGSEASIGQEVFVFGNSDGGGVATSLTGKVLGVGPDRIEIDAAFVQGNSGSPVLGADGRILGVATYATLDNDPKQWIKRGSRFGGVRRFGLRIDNIKWVRLDWEDYRRRAQTLADLSTYLQDVYDMMYAGKYTHKTGTGIYQLSYDFAQHKKKYLFASALCKNLSDAADRFNQFMNRAHATISQADDYSRTRNAIVRRDLERKHSVSRNVAMLYGDRLDASWQKLYSLPAPTILRSDWKTKAFKDEALNLLEILQILARNSE